MSTISYRLQLTVGVVFLFQLAGCATSHVKSERQTPVTALDTVAYMKIPSPYRSEVKTASHTSDNLETDSIVAGAVTSYENDASFSANHSYAGMTLADFESLAFANNPTIRELAATTHKAAGFRTQVGLNANPIIGYQAVQLADRGTDQHTAFIEQEIVTANKLALNRNVLNEALRSQLFELETQKLRIATDVRVKFYAALAAQRSVELISNFQTVADQGLELAKLRRNALEGSKVDVLQANVQKNEIDLALQQSQVSYMAAWRELAAIAGTAELEAGVLQGELPNFEEELDWYSVAASIVSASPEYRAAQARIRRARANLERQDVQAVPNVTAQLAAGVDNGTNSGLLNLQIGAPIPVFNKNQGNIAAARAEYCRAVMDAERISNAIKARLATVSREYDNSRAAVAMYSQEILPNAEESLELAEVAYKAGETSFIQVLVSRRTYFDSNLQYVLAQAQLAQARSRVDGYVLSGALDAVIDESGDDSLRGLTFGQQ